MSSGKYSALSGAITRMQQMNSISDNLANSMTVGFKKSGVAFEARLADALNLQSHGALSLTRGKEGITDHSPGHLAATGVPTHLAILGEGFFKVEDGPDSVAYTRQGSFQLDGDGFLITGAGLKVLGEDGNPIQLTSPEPLIDQSGTITLEDGGVRKIALYSFDDPGVLLRKGGGLFTVDRETIRTSERQLENPLMLQGSVENSNVNTMQEMSKMIETVRVFEACQKMLKNYGSLDENAIQLGKLA